MTYNLSQKNWKMLAFINPAPPYGFIFPASPTPPPPHALSIFLQNLLQLHDLFKSYKTGIVDEIITNHSFMCCRTKLV